MQIGSTHLSGVDGRPPWSVGQRKRPSAAPAFAGMIMALVILGREPILVAARRMLARPRRSAIQPAPQSLPSLRDLIIGQGQRAVLKMFGLPRATTGGQRTVWYYPLHAPNRLAMAISFDDHRATDVEFFDAPSVVGH